MAYGICSFCGSPLPMKERVKMDMNSEYIIILCGEFADGNTRLTRAEFWKLYHKYNDSMDELIAAQEEKIEELLKRSASIAFGKEKLEQMGVRISTVLDEDFPQALLEKLGDFCPPLLYTVGSRQINQQKMAGYVGSRDIGNEDIAWTEERVDENLKKGFGIVTGGAQGIDSVALLRCLKQGGSAIVYFPDTMKQRMGDALLREAVFDQRLLMYSHVSPLAAKSRHSFVATARERNKYIYAQSKATVVVRSDLNKGGTWSGATEALKHRWTTVFVWDNKNYPGNQELIRRGAIPLLDDGKMPEKKAAETVPTEEKKTEEKEFSQMSFEDLMKQGDSSEE